jgi:transmembrane sensor
VVAALCLSGYLWINRGVDQPVAQTEKKIPTELLPGRDGAILTLGDGQQIILDSAAPGKLAEQGKTTITHQDGQISYSAGSQQDNKVVYNTTSTPRGRQYRLKLGDGTVIWLNAASSVTYPTAFAGRTREISITGEVYIEVSEDKKKPFIVHAAGETAIEVLGTRFAVNAYPDEPFARTTLLEGSVKLSASIQGKKSHTILKPGQQLQVGHEKLNLIKDANVEEATAFVHGFFHFDKANIRTVMRQLEKWYDIRVSFSEGVSNRTFAGEIERNLPLPVVLTILEQSGARFSVEGNHVQVK